MTPQHQNTHTYSVLDAARIFGELDTAQKLQTNFLSLYMGQSEELLSAVAPYLFAYQPDSEFGKWLSEKGWGNSWGMFVETAVSIDELRKHFRKFLLVKTEENEELYFRFYDPRVLRIFLPTCDEQQLVEFFGPISQLIMEDEDPKFALKFSLRNSQLHTQKIPKEDFLPSHESNVEVKPVEERRASKLFFDDTPKEEPAPQKPSKPNNGWSFLVD